MDALTRLMSADQYSMDAAVKDPAMLEGLNALTEHHRLACVAYQRMLDAAGSAVGPAPTPADLPYLPVSIFKWLDLRSIPQEDVFKVLVSSGTTGQVPSRITLDVATARMQTRALTSIVTHYTGPRRLPMLIVDHPSVIQDRHRISARGAGILGMMNYGRDHHYLLDDQLVIDRQGLDEWLAAHEGEDLLIFGFTFMVWQYLVDALGAEGPDLSRAVLIHSGGWKKLLDIAVTNEVFKAELRRAFGTTRVHNFYGMVEQVGSVFLECPEGHLHAPNFADVMVRDPVSWGLQPSGVEGVIEVVSLLPRSYPGHILLTEDLGAIHGVDDCPCGRRGTRFSVSGRIPRAEIRGCSDVLAHGIEARS